MSITKTDIVNWTVHNELRGGISAEIVLNNLDNLYGEFNLNEYIDLSGYYSGYSSYSFFKGNITESEVSYGVRGELNCTLRANSIFRSLDKKPVNTERLTSISGANLMTRIVVEYGGVDSSYVNIVEDNGVVFDNIIISEDSIISVLRKLAQVCQVELFIKNGQLVTEKYKTDSSPIDYTFAKSDISEQTLSYSLFDESSCVVVRGRFYTDQDIAPITIFDDYVEYNSRYDFFSASFFIPLDKCYDLYTIQTATVTAPDDPDVDVIGSGVESLDGCWMGVTLHSSNYVTNRKIRLVITAKPISLKERSGRSWKDNYRPIWMSALTPFQPLSGWRAGLPYMPKVRGWVYKVFPAGLDEEAEDRINYTACDTGLVSEVGYRYTEIDNQYIFSETIAQQVAQRFLQELKQARKRWVIRAPWNPNVNLNSKVSFPIIGTSLTKTGVVVTQDISWNARDGGVDATYTIEELS